MAQRKGLNKEKIKEARDAVLPDTGVIRTIADMFFPSEQAPMPGDFGVGGLAIAAVKPDKIPALREAGRQLLERIKKEGLKQTSMGWPAQDFEPRGIIDKLLRRPAKKSPAPNIPADPELIKVLEFAQQRYPRIFGHLTDIQDVDRFMQATAFPGRVRGASGPDRGGGLNFDPNVPIRTPNPRMSNMQIDANPPSASAFYGPPDVPRTVGHELLHTIDRIINGNEFDDMYSYLQKTFGYDNISPEIQARNSGDSFAQKYYQWLAKQQGK